MAFLTTGTVTMEDVDAFFLNNPTHPTAAEIDNLMADQANAMKLEGKTDGLLNKSADPNGVITFQRLWTSLEAAQEWVTFVNGLDLTYYSVSISEI